MNGDPLRDDAAEKAALSAVLYGGEGTLDELVTDYGLEPGSFYDPRHGLVFEVCQRVQAAGRPVDPMTVSAALSADERRRLGEGALLPDLVSVRVPVQSAGWYAKAIQDCALLRGVAEAGTRAVQLAYSAPHDEAEAVRERAVADMDRITVATPQDKPSPLGALLPDAVERIDSGRPRGVPTGLYDLDALLGGINPQTLTIVGARTSVGKTMFAVNVAAGMAGQGVPTYFASLEMSKGEVADRFLARQSRVDLARIMAGHLGEREWDRVAHAQSTMMEWPLIVDDSSALTVPQMRSRVRKAMRKRKPKFVVVDYLQLVRPRDRRISREQQVAEISGDLKAWAKDLNCPVMALAQLNRSPEARSDKTPMLADLRESGAIENDADIVILLHRPSPEEPLLDAIVAKNRQGPTGVATLSWQPALMHAASAARQEGIV